MEILNSLADGADRDTLDGLFDLLLNGKGADSLISSADSPCFASTYDTANKESFYHGFMLGMTALFLEKIMVSNRIMKADMGGLIRHFSERYFKSRCHQVEFKSARWGKQLEEKAKEALQQIEDRKYETAFEQRGISMVWEHGIAL